MIGAAQSNKVLSIIPLIKRMVRVFKPVSAKLGFPVFLYCGTMDKTLYVRQQSKVETHDKPQQQCDCLQFRTVRLQTLSVEHTLHLL